MRPKGKKKSFSPVRKLRDGASEEGMKEILGFLFSLKQIKIYWVPGTLLNLFTYYHMWSLAVIVR